MLSRGASLMVKFLGSMRFFLIIIPQDYHSRASDPSCKSLGSFLWETTPPVDWTFLEKIFEMAVLLAPISAEAL